MCKNNHLLWLSWACYRRFAITSLFIALRDADQIVLKETPKFRGLLSNRGDHTLKSLKPHHIIKRVSSLLLHDHLNINHLYNALAAV